MSLRSWASASCFWFVMQTGLILGFATAYPVVVSLIRRGTKEAV